MADFSDWSGQVRSAHIKLAHQVYTSDASSDGLLFLLIAVDFSLSWVLRTVRCVGPGYRMRWCFVSVRTTLATDWTGRMREVI